MGREDSVLWTLKAGVGPHLPQLSRAGSTVLPEQVCRAHLTGYHPLLPRPALRAVQPLVSRFIDKETSREAKGHEHK